MMPNTSLFLYGTLEHAPLLEIVLGRPADLRPARWPGKAVVWASGQSHPMIVDGAGAAGALLDGLAPEDRARLDFYEAGFGFGVNDIWVDGPDGPVQAAVYVPVNDVDNPGAPWSLDDWVRQWGDLTVRAASEVMGLFGQIEPSDLPRRLPTIRMRAGSAIRAEADNTPTTLRVDTQSGAVDVKVRRRPYTSYFAVAETELAFPRFDGNMSEPVLREAFHAADAVTVLPYDPVRDRVLIIEQFRYGVWVRGDQRPWCLEPIAGRIDPGETAEETARREAVEEAGLNLGALHPIGSYYPSPGALTEYLYTFIGIADLPDEAARLGGLDVEAEDIRGHVMSFDALMALVDSGEIDTGPLVLSALWLARMRSDLRDAT